VLTFTVTVGGFCCESWTDWADKRSVLGTVFMMLVSNSRGASKPHRATGRVALSRIIFWQGNH